MCLILLWFFFFFILLFFFFCLLFFFLMIRRPPRSTLDRSSAASDVYKRQPKVHESELMWQILHLLMVRISLILSKTGIHFSGAPISIHDSMASKSASPVSYTHLRAHETVLDLVCRLLLEQKNNKKKKHTHLIIHLIRATYTHR